MTKILFTLLTNLDKKTFYEQNVWVVIIDSIQSSKNNYVVVIVIIVIVTITLE